MTTTEAKRIIYRKCKNCKWWSCAVWQSGEPIEDFGICLKHGHRWQDGEEECCRGFDYAKWAIDKTIKESEKLK